MKMDLQAIAHRYGGSYRNGRALIPTPGHSRRDRGTSITAVPGAPDGVLVHCFNGTPTDAIAVKMMLRQDGFLDRRENARELTDAEKLSLKRDLAQRVSKAHQVQERVAAVAAEIWSCSPAADPSHEYLRAKGIPACGIRQDGDSLLVPMSDATGALWNLQQIFPNGRKLFLKEGRVNGLVFVYDARPGPIVIGEGYGSLAAINRATGLSFAVAFVAGNLRAVATLLRARFRDRELIVAADDDGHLLANPNIKRNIGVEAATKAAHAARATLVTPRVTSDDTSLDFGDLNDTDIRARFGRIELAA